MPASPSDSHPSAAATQRRILALAWPVMLSNITVPLLGLVDSAILGHLDNASHLGAVAIGAQLFTLLCWSFGFLRMGTTAACARSLSERGVQDALQHGMWLALALMPPLLLMAWLLLPPLLPWMGASALVESGAREYLQIRALAIPAVLLQYVFTGWFIGRGDTRVPLVVMVLTNLVNASLDAVLVFGVGMTADGVALGSVLADYTGLLAAYGFARRVGLPGVRQWLAQWPGLATLQPLIRINRQLFVRTLVLLLVLTLFQAGGARQDDLVLAANSLLLSLLMLIANALDGFAHAAESLAGQALARQQSYQVRQLVRLTGLDSLLLAMVLTLLCALGGDWLWPLLTDNPQLLPVLDQYSLFLAGLPLIGFGSYWLDGVAIAAGATTTMRNAMLLSALVFLGIWQLLGFMGNAGLWLALYGFLLCRALAALPFLRRLYLDPLGFAPKS